MPSNTALGLRPLSRQVLIPHLQPPQQTAIRAQQLYVQGRLVASDWRLYDRSKVGESRRSATHSVSETGGAASRTIDQAGPDDSRTARNQIPSMGLGRDLSPSRGSNNVTLANPRSGRRRSRQLTKTSRVGRPTVERTYPSVGGIRPPLDLFPELPDVPHGCCAFRIESR